MKIVEQVVLDLTDEVVVSIEQFTTFLMNAKRQVSRGIFDVRLNRTQEYLLRQEMNGYMVDNDGKPIDLSDTVALEICGCKIEIV